MRFYTIGHSDRTMEAFVSLLAPPGIELLVDVRSVPRSRANPQFEGPHLEAALAKVGIAYRHLPLLGGWRGKRMPVSPNQGWHVASFRRYADYMQTEAFARGLDELLALGRDCQVVYMCAEAVPWRCHRRLISDCLVFRGHEVLDIVSAASPRAHRLTPFAVRVGSCVIYPGS